MHHDSHDEADTNNDTERNWFPKRQRRNLGRQCKALSEGDGRDGMAQRNGHAQEPPTLASDPTPRQTEV